MKNTAMACLILILAGCTVAPTNGVTSASPPPSPMIIPTAKAEPASESPILVEPAREQEEMVSAADPVKKMKKSQASSRRVDMKERVAFANQIMKDESAGSDSPVVCDTKAHRTPAGQLIYESSCH